MARLRVALWPLALLAGFGALGIYITSNHDDEAAISAVLTLLLGWSFSLSGLVAWSRRPSNRFGALMVATGFAFFLTSLTAANDSTLYTIGRVVEKLPFALVIHLLLAYPRGRLEWWVSRAIVATAYASTVGLQVASLCFDRPTVAECPGCPANALLVTRNDTLAEALDGTGQVIAVLVTLAVGVIYWLRWQGASPPARRTLGPVLVTGTLALFLLALSLILGFFVSDLVESSIFVLSAVVLSTVPLASLAGLLQSRLAQSAVGNLLVELGQSLPPGELRDALARALGDPSLTVGYWLPEAQVFVDHEGRPLPPPDPQGSRRGTWVERNGERIAALVHDESLLEEPQLIEAVVAAAGLTLENERRLAALARSESRNRALLNAMPDVMFRIARDGTYLAYKAEEGSDLFSNPDELIGKNVRDVLPRDVAGPMMRCVAEALEPGSTRTIEFEHELELDGTRRFFEARIVPAEVDEVVMIVRDFTERRRAQEQLEGLQVELQRHLQELQASRARIVAVADQERRRLERNLHDGAQQRLVSVSLTVRLAQARLDADPATANELLQGASEELATALEELRELARGIHPAVLTDRGLGPALESLVTRTPVPVEVEAPVDERLPGPVEAAAYYVVSEALANVAKYANASQAAVRVSRQNGVAVVEVEDDGVGGADPSRGSGLRGLADRVEALAGRLAVDSEPGRGTRIRAEIPCA
ncbi:MAG TPA: histidine kinase [Gaiellaceae bacterium]|jgi:PAS domain S-box-containing protein|nr:histidine kinase [Gaiellaceae bacterium]